MTVASKDDGGTDHDISALEGDHVELFEVGKLRLPSLKAKGEHVSLTGPVSSKPVLRHAGTPFDRFKYRFRIFDASTGIDF